MRIMNTVEKRDFIHSHLHQVKEPVINDIYTKMISLFNESLMFAEDTEMFWKMALKCRLKNGIINVPVAIRGVHEKNVFNRDDLYENDIWVFLDSSKI